MRILIILLITLAHTHGADIRVATYNVLTGIEAPGTMGHEAAKSVLARINADVVGLQEVRGTDLTGSPSHIEALASSLGYSHIFIPSGNALDTVSRVALLSKFPFSETHSIASPNGAKDVARAHAAALIDVPGTDADPMVITLHLKCCLEFVDPFRRAVEIERIKFFLDDQNLSGSDNVIVMGDYNLIGSDASYTSPPSPMELPTSFILGSDISFPVNYFENPADYFTAYPLFDPQPRQQDGIKTFTQGGSSTLDYLIISEALFDRGPVLEIYSSELDAAFPGLPKSGAVLPFGTSDLASDHLPIFGDFDLEAGLLPLSISLTSTNLTEGASPSILTVTLPSPPATGETVTVLLSSSDCEEAMPLNLTLTFTAGITTQSTSIIPKADSIIDGPQSVTLTASASGFLADSTEITVLDQDNSTYLITALNSPILESFDGYAGQQAPAAWTSSAPDFQGFDDGLSSARGPRSYGRSSEGSLGILTGEEVVFLSNFQNSTGREIHSLQIAYAAEHWQSLFNGGQDQLEVSLIVNGITTLIPTLSFTATNDLPTGPITAPSSTEFQATLSGLTIPSNSAFQLQFRVIPTTPLGDRAFINEFHYDNTGSDENEFVEIILGPNFAGTIDDLSLHFYNGLNASEYKSHSFSTSDFNQTLPSGHRIYSAAISGIQNGAPDGIALVQDSSDVLQFLSYEGQFTATNGPASGMTSVDTGANQSPAPAAGTGSIGLSGEGSGPDDFTWTRAVGPFTQGDSNENQLFGSFAKGQGIAIDNLSVTALAPSLKPSLSDDLFLHFPTISGTNYTVETSTDLFTWSPFMTILGDGSTESIDVATGDARRFFRVRED